eukprot:jgi/Chrzof1/10795/Cz05g12110.t1
MSASAVTSQLAQAWLRHGHRTSAAWYAEAADKPDHTSATQLALSTCGLVLVCIALCAPLQRHVRRICSPTCTRIVQRQLPWVRWAQSFTHPSLDVPVYASAITVSVEFYLSMLPTLIWLGHAELGMKLISLLAISGYVTFAIKDIIASPRPGEAVQSPDSKVHIVVRDISGDIEDGVPSAHCSLSVPIMFYSLRQAAHMGFLPNSWLPGLSIGCLLWVAWVAWGRLYLGLHSPLDLAAGTMVGFMMLDLWELQDDAVIAWARSSPMAPVAMLAVAFLLLRLYPAPARFTDCYTYATAWTSAWFGGMLGFWQYSHLLQGTQRLWGEHLGDQHSMYRLVAAKVATGLVLVVLTKLVVKAVMLALLPALFAVVPHQVRSLWQPPIAAVSSTTKSSSSARCSGCEVPCRANGVAWDVDTFARFCSYAAAVNVVMQLHVCWPTILSYIVV